MSTCSVATVGYVALVWDRSTISTKVRAQKAAFETLAEKGTIGRAVSIRCFANNIGQDLVSLGPEVVIKFHRSGRLHSVRNILFGYPQLYRALLRYLKEEGVDILYFRKPPMFSPLTTFFMRSARAAGIIVVLEVPTFPYEQELRPFGLLRAMDKLGRIRLNKAVDFIATFSEHSRVFNVEAINISNGAAVESLPISRVSRRSSQIRLICVSALERWHRVDRLVKPLLQAWSEGDDRVESLTIVGDGMERGPLTELVKQFPPHVRRRVRFVGFLYGAELSAAFDAADLAIGNLEERGDRGLEQVQALKHREYAARGLPFIYGLTDSDFFNCSYALQLSEGDLDIEVFLDWLRHLEMDKTAIREDSRRFSWTLQLERVVEAAAIPADRVRGGR